MTIPMLPLAAALTENPTLLDAISYQAVGLIVVFTALGSIWGLLELMGWIFRAAERRAAARVTEPVLEAEPGLLLEPGMDGISPQVVAVITAAAHECLQAGERIVSIMPVHLQPNVDVNLLAWSGEGRRQIFASHKLR